MKFEGIGQEVLVQSGDFLFEAGDEGGDIFEIVDGEVEILHPGDDGSGRYLVVGHQTAGDVVGEVVAVVGGVRTASARAITPLVANVITKEEFDSWLESNPEAGAEMSAQARARLDRSRVARVLVDIVHITDSKIVSEITSRVSYRMLEAGEVLFNQGDEADAAYIVLAGRLRVHAVHNGTTTLDVEVGRGEIVGELGLIENEPRSAGISAARETTLAVIGREDFEELTRTYPALMLQLFRRIAARADQSRPRSAAAGTVAIAVLSPSAPAGLVEAMRSEVEKYGPSITLNRQLIDTNLDRPNIADSPPGSPGQALLAEFMHDVDVSHRHVLLETDDELTPWTRRALASADRVVLIISARPNPDEADRINRFVQACGARRDDGLWAARIHPPATSMPTGTAALIQRYGFDRVLHLRHDDPPSVSRLARLMTGNGFGVAMSGGGARGFAHIGAIRALLEANVPIDTIGGTSMGSIMGGLFALGWGPDRVNRVAVKEFEDARLLDYTVPVVSILKGEAMTAGLNAHMGDHDIEDAWIPFFCLSTNVTRFTKREHRTGNLARAVRASVSLPGIFPPVADDGDLLVDGGVMENLPISGFVADGTIGTIIAVEASPPEGPKATPDQTLSISGIHAIRSRLSRNRESYSGLLDMVMGSIIVGSSLARADAISSGVIDLYLSLDLENVGLLDFGSVTPVAERGYLDAVPQIEAWKATTRIG